MYRRRTAASAMAVGLALVASACGGSEEIDESGGLTGEPIKLMVIAPQDVAGSPSNKPQAQGAVRAAAAELNAAGGVDGRPFEVSFCNERYDANVAVSCARKAIDTGVVAVVGSYLQVPSNVHDVLGDAGIPVVGSFPLLAQDLKNPNSYILSTGGVMAYAGVAQKAAENGAKSGAVMAYTDNPGAVVAAKFVKAAMEAHGITPAEKIEGIKTGSPDAAAPTSAALDNDPDLVIATVAAPDYAKVITAARQAGSEVQFGGSSVTLLPLIEQIPDLLEGTILSNDFPIDGPLAESYNKAFDEYGDDDLITDDLSIGGYLGVNLIADLLADVDTIDGPSLKEALDNLEGYDFGPLQDFGYTGDIVFSELPRVRNTSVTVGEIKGGKTVFEEELAEPLTPDYIKAIDEIYAGL